jgi:outer membrane protein assembly factor BamB
MLALLLSVLFPIRLALADPGDLKWQTTGFDVGTSPAIGAFGNLYVGQNWPGTKVYMVNPTTGESLKDYDVGYSTYELTIAPDGTVYVPAGATLFALNSNLTFKWQVPGTLWFHVALAADGTVYAGHYDNKVYAMDPANGNVKWASDLLAGYPWNPVVAPDGTIYVGTSDYEGMFYSLDPLNGHIKKSYKTGGSGASDSAIIACPAIAADGTIYVVNYNSKVFAFNPDLTVKWPKTLSPSTRILASPALAPDGTIYVGTRDTYKLYALNPGDGAQKWPPFTTGYEITSSPLVGSDGIIYVGSCDSKVYALDPATGAKLWDYPAGNWINMPMAMGPDGTGYAVSGYNKTMYALYSSSTGLAGSSWPMFRHEARHTGRGGAGPVTKDGTPANLLLLGN